MNMFSNILNIWRKELLDSVRDRKALSQALIIPLIIGVLYAVINPLITAAITERAKEAVTIPVQGLEYAPQDFVTTLKLFGITLKPYESDLEATVAQGDVAAGMIIPPGFAEALKNEEVAKLTLLTNRTSGGMFGGQFSTERLSLAFEFYNRMIAVQRLKARNLEPKLLNPISLSSRDLASPEQLAGLFASFTLPILLAVLVAQGGFFIAIDVTAGEKERGTLEALLVTPARDVEVFLGKLAAVFVMSCLPIILTFLGFWAASNLLPESVSHGARLPIGVVVGTILISMPLALFLNVVLMMISIRTKTFKDAQSALTPVVLGVMVPAMAAAFIPAKESLAYLIPIYGTSAVVSTLATGGTLPPYAALLSIVGSLLAAFVCMIFALRLFNRERLLYSM
jgi:sodium transport system permease protein